MKRLLTLAFALMLMLTATALAEGKLRVGMECNYAPFNWTQTESSEFAVPLESGGYADGFDVQIAKYIADKLDMELEIVKTEWDGLIMGAVSGMTDVIIAGMTATDERKMSIDFTDDYYASEIVLVVRKDGKFADAKSIADFNGATITGQLGTLHYDYIDDIPGAVKLMAMDTFPAMIVALQSGMMDAYIAELPGAQADTTANPDLMYIQFPKEEAFSVSVAVGLKQGSELKDKINAILAELDQATREQMMSDATERQPLNQ